MNRFFPAFGSVLFFLASASVSAQGATSYGTIEYSYLNQDRPNQDHARTTYRRNIDMDAYVASDGSKIIPLQSTEESVCDLVESPDTPAFPAPAPPPNFAGIPPSTDKVEIHQLPLGGIGGWYQKVEYYRVGHPKPDGTWDLPIVWGNPLTNQIHARIPDPPCKQSSE